MMAFEEFKTRHEQIDSSVRFILNNDAYYESLRSRPSRVNAAALKMIMDGQHDGYHFRVVRAALRQFSCEGAPGFIDADEPPYSREDLYPPPR